MLLGHQKIKGDFERLIGLDRLAHGYFFFGPAGAGKRFFAEEFARSLERGSWFEKNDARPLSDALFIAPDEKDTIGIDAVRSIKLFLGERPNISKYRLVVIDRADALTTEAQNALLKITEEPPVRTLLILIAAGKESLLPTLISRLQAVYFGRVSNEELTAWLIGQGVAKKAAAEAATLSDGKPGLALAWSKGYISPIQAAARDFLSIPVSARKDFLKALLEPEEFSFRSFLDALILTLSLDKQRKELGRLWHAVLELRAMADATGLNPSIQLRNIWSYL